MLQRLPIASSLAPDTWTGAIVPPADALVIRTGVRRTRARRSGRVRWRASQSRGRDGLKVFGVNGAVLGPRSLACAEQIALDKASVRVCTESALTGGILGSRIGVRDLTKALRSVLPKGQDLSEDPADGSAQLDVRIGVLNNDTRGC